MQFYEFLENVKFGRYHFDGVTHFIPEKKQLEMATAHPFVFLPKEERGISVPENVDKIDLPFKRCFFEFLNSSISGVIEDGVEIDIAGIYAEELSPGKYDLYGQMKFSNDPRTSLLRIPEGQKYDIMRNHFLGMIRLMLDRISSEEIGYAKAGHKIKIKTKQGNNFVKINKVIYVSPKKMMETAEKKAAQVIDWSHQWTVRGHWRNIPGRLGKDRDGLPMADYTWVNNYIKGPEHAPLVNKVRVVKDQSLVQD